MQGDFEAHSRALKNAGAEPVEVRTAQQLRDLDALVLPGGESTTMLKLIDDQQLFEPLRKFGQTKPMFGTCAGAILMASEVLNPSQPSLSLVDVGIERNGYGRQIDSRIANIDLDGKSAEAVFIRAPVIRRTGHNVKVLARYQGAPVLVEEGRHLVATFHPELTADGRIHRHFVGKITSSAAPESKS